MLLRLWVTAMTRMNLELLPNLDPRKRLPRIILAYLMATQTKMKRRRAPN
jgi:hypothetical protein